MKIIKLAIFFTALLFAGQLWAANLLASASPAQHKILLKLAKTTNPSHDFLVKAVNSLTPQQLASIAQIAPNIKITADLLDKVYQISYNSTLSVKERGKRLKALVGIDDPSEYITRRVCIWDPVGRSGPIFQAAIDQKANALRFGVNLDLEAYTDEGIVVSDLRSGKCDAALISGLRARLFNKFTGTTDSIGGIRSDKEMYTLLKVLATPTMAGHMVQGPYVTLGIAQGGAAYVFVDDRSISSLAKAAGKKVAVLAYDKVQAEMVAQIGAIPVPASLITAPNMFNNGTVDVLAAPLVAYDAMELYKGMTPNGGIIDYPLAQITMQLIGRRARIPNVIGQLIRESFFANYNKINNALTSRVKDIPEHWWIQIPEKDKDDYEHIMQQARLQLRDRGYYSADMLTLQRKIRCKFHPKRGECTNPVE